MKQLHLVEIQNRPIFEQLQLEEALLRTDQRNVCIINRGSPRAIVLGLSGKPDELLHQKEVREEEVPVIRRFSGGGCVVVDEDTLFISFLFTKSDHSTKPFPEPILRWATDLYRDAWGLDSFGLRENDFVLGEKKCGGNAQYIQKERWVLHTSFLWDFQKECMALLKLPKKRPAYREDRPHEEFLCRLKEHAASPATLIEGLKRSLSKHWALTTFKEEELALLSAREYRRSTIKLDY